MMETQSQHTMVLKQQFEDGAQEWECPVCGRRFIMQWPPHYKRIILEAGDTNAFHSGSTGGLVMGSAEVVPEQDSFPVESLDQPSAVDDTDDPYLALWEDWLNQQNL